MTSRHRGADTLVKAMASAGVRRIFTLSGNHIMPIFDAAFDAGIVLIHTRHEAAAVHMADAWARLTGEPGIALVTGGPGHANALGALYTAAMAESPVVLLSGHAPNHQLGMGAFQEMRQADIAAPLAKAAFTSARAGDVARDFVRAIREARSGRPGPVQLSLPTDCLNDEADMENVPRAEAFFNDAMALDVSVADGMLEQLRRARHPLILAGPALMTRKGRQSTARLQEVLQIPVIGMESPRGIADPSLGAFAQILAQVDCILLLGKRLDFTLKFGKPPAFDAHCEFLQIDAESEEIERTGRAVHARLSVSALAEPFAAAEMLARCAQAKPAAKCGWLGETQAAIGYRPAEWDTAKSGQSDRIHPVEALRPLQAILDGHPDSVFISDGGEFGQWAQACLSAPNRIINGVAGSIGAALPFALAARIAKPDVPVIAVMGDGTFGFHPAEIDTAVRYGLPFVCVVGNDSRWNAEYQIQLREYGRSRLHSCELLPTRYDRVAIAFGGYGELVTSVKEVGPAAHRAMMSGRPACINILIEGLAAPSHQ